MTVSVFPIKGINKYVSRYIKLLELKGKHVLNVPCEDGCAMYELLKKWAEIIPLKLYLEFLKISEAKVKRPLSEPLPLVNETVDYVVC
jgi:hypothetical protein